MLPEERQKLLQNKTVFISCIVPVFNEEAVIEEFMTDLQTTLHGLTQQFEIILIDDGSRDETISRIRNFPKHYNVKLLGLSRNFGKEIALTAGLEHCSGDVAILLDADFQHPVDMLPCFLEHWADGYDMVYGARNNRGADPYFKRSFAHLFYWLMKKITKINIPKKCRRFSFNG